MDHSVFDLVDKRKRFFRVLFENPYWMAICCISIGLFSYISISFADMTSQDAYDASYLGTTLICESGPFFDESAKRHVTILKEFKDFMKERHLAGALSFLPDKYNFEKSLDSALATLENAQKTGDKEKIAEAIWKAGEQLVGFKTEAINYPRMKIVLRENPKITEWLVHKIETVCDESENALRRFQKNPTLYTAFELCEHNRDTMRWLTKGRGLLIGLSNDEPNQFLERFRKIVIDSKLAYDKQEDLPEAEKYFFKLFTKSELARRDILNAIANNELQEADILQYQLVESTMSMRPKILELSKVVEKNREKQADL